MEIFKNFSSMKEQDRNALSQISSVINSLSVLTQNLDKDIRILVIDFAKIKSEIVSLKEDLIDVLKIVRDGGEGTEPVVIQIVKISSKIERLTFQLEEISRYNEQRLSTFESRIQPVLISSSQPSVELSKTFWNEHKSKVLVAVIGTIGSVLLVLIPLVIHNEKTEPPKTTQDEKSKKPVNEFEF